MNTKNISIDRPTCKVAIIRNDESHPCGGYAILGGMCADHAASFGFASRPTNPEAERIARDMSYTGSRDYQRDAEE